MELRHLRYFVALAEELHFGRAAARLNMSQPPLSQQLKRLEDEIGTTLLLRTSRRVELTPAGTAFLPEARKTLAQANRAIEIAALASTGSTGHLAVGFVSSATDALPRVLRRFRELAPRVNIAVKEASSSQQIDLLRSGLLDVGLLRPPIAAADIHLETVADERLVIALPSDHRLADAEIPTLAVLSGEPFILFSREAGMGLYDQIIASCRNTGFSPQVAQVSGSMITIVGLVAGGLGVALVPESLARQAEGIVFRSAPDLAGTVPLAAAWHGAERSPAISALVRAAQTTVADGGGPPAG